MVFKLTHYTCDCTPWIRQYERHFDRCLFRTVNISTPWCGFWRTTRQTWIWGSPSTKSSLDRCVQTQSFPVKRQLSTICDTCVFLFNFTRYIPFFIFRLTSMNWSRAAQRLSSLMKPRRNTSSKQQRENNSSPKCWTDGLTLTCRFVFLTVWWCSGGLWTGYRSRWQLSKR